jgi:hypothetical protein
MPDSRLPEAERHLQHSFMKSFVLSGLSIWVIVVGAHRPIERLPNREPMASARVPLSFEPVALRSAEPHLSLVGAWEMKAPDRRLDGLSALTIDGASFLAISDSGVVVRFGKPGSPDATIELSDLPSGPGRSDRKAGNDAEAMARDPWGRGWWVAFESIHQLRLYDSNFRHTLEVRPLDGRRWRDNGGVEGLVALRDRLLLIAEGGDLIAQFDGRSVAFGPIDPPAGRLSDAVVLDDAQLLLMTRTITPLGFRNGLTLYDLRTKQLRVIASLPLGHLDNAEGVAAEHLPDGTIRLWILTDRDSRAQGRTLLAAFDWKP